MTERSTWTLFSIISLPTTFIVISKIKSYKEELTKNVLNEFAYIKASSSSVEA